MFNLELYIYKVFIWMIYWFVISEFSLLFWLLAFAFYVFVCLICLHSVWVGLVFFLVYIGALLVLFFFIFSLRGKDSFPAQQSRSLAILCAVRVRIFSLKGCLIWKEKEVFSKVRETAVLSRDLASLLLLVSFVCLVVWNLSSLSRFKKTPLRPFY